MRHALCFCLLLVFTMPVTAYALTMEDGADAPTRGVEDYIKDYVDVPEGATDWKLFGKTEEVSTETKDSDGLDVQYYKPKFPDALTSLDGKRIKIKGFMFPLDEAEGQKLFLFGPFPLNCPFQYHVQPSLVIEVHAGKKPIEFTYDPITLDGTLELVPEDRENSTFYRLRGASVAKEFDKPRPSFLHMRP